MDYAISIKCYVCNLQCNVYLIWCLSVFNVVMTLTKCNHGLMITFAIIRDQMSQCKDIHQRSDHIWCRICRLTIIDCQSANATQFSICNWDHASWLHSPLIAFTHYFGTCTLDRELKTSLACTNDALIAPSVGETLQWPVVNLNAGGLHTLAFKLAVSPYIIPNLVPIYR